MNEDKNKINIHTYYLIKFIKNLVIISTYKIFSYSDANTILFKISLFVENKIKIIIIVGYFYNFR